MRRFGGILLALACLALATSAQGQAPYPSRPIRILIPYAPGGLTDVVTRQYAEHMRKSLGVNILVENKPGASGIIAIEEMARAKPDGYTIMVGNISTNCLTPVLLAKRMHIDYDRDVQIIARTADAPVFFLATTVNFPRRRSRSSSPTPRRIRATCVMPRAASAPTSTSTPRSWRSAPVASR